jgi:hypothetical protein
MKLRGFAASLSIVFLIGAFIMALDVVKASEMSTTKIFTDPSIVQANEIDKEFTININISNVDDLYAWQTGITFNPAVLECTGFYEGEFLRKGGETWFLKHYLDKNNTLGIVYYRGCCLLGPVAGVSGSGQLACVTFRSVGKGISDFHLTDVIFQNSKLEELAFEIVENFTVQVDGINYSIGILSNLTGTMGAAEPLQSGTFDLSFNRQDKKISFDESSQKDWFCKVTVPKELLKCTAPSDWSVRVDEAPTPYIITETDAYTSLNFMHVKGAHTVEVTGAGVVEGNPCDLNNDGNVDICDLFKVAKAHGSHGPDIPNQGDPSSENWNAIADLNKDMWVNIEDIFMVARDFGKKPSMLL